MWVFTLHNKHEYIFRLGFGLIQTGNNTPALTTEMRCKRSLKWVFQRACNVCEASFPLLGCMLTHVTIGHCTSSELIKGVGSNILKSFALTSCVHFCVLSTLLFHSQVEQEGLSDLEVISQPVEGENQRLAPPVQLLSFGYRDLPLATLDLSLAGSQLLSNTDEDDNRDGWVLFGFKLHHCVLCEYEGTEVWGTPLTDLLSQLIVLQYQISL